MISEALRFAPTLAVLNDVLAELDELGSAGGGAIDASTRREALETFTRFVRVPQKMPPRWRHAYHALAYDDLMWSTGRARVPALPRYTAAAAGTNGSETDAPALALENAGGVVHLGSPYLEPARPLGDSRVTLLALADAKRMLRGRSNAISERVAAADTDGFAALACAFQNCGAFVDVPDGVRLDAPLQLVWASRPGEASAVFSRVVVRVGAGARATIVERHVGSTESFVCGIVEVELSEGAALDYVVVQQADEGARAIVHRSARCAAGARMGWH
ncbi:MAG: SufD family Fe-S cluster assembly protein, partial [Candidatus Eremiobacteraeota bacterium]|nr:SufD family Fe-S cluster assembly protein [Candidatus Eremiobacteraeota bacterium]